MSKSSTTSKKARPREISSFLLFVSKHQYPLIILFHIVIFAVSLLVAFLLWFDAGPKSVHDATIGLWLFEKYFPLLPFFVVLKLVIFGRLRIFRGGWQYSGIRDIAQILLASWLFAFIGFACWYVLSVIPLQMGQAPIPVLTKYFGLFPRGVLLLDFLATVFLACSARLGLRIYREELRPISVEGRTRVLIIGAGNSAEAIIREIHRQRIERYRVIGLVDDDPRKQKMHIHEVPVLGTTDEIPEICKENDIEELIIAMPAASQKQLREVIEKCAGTKLKFQALPGISDLIDGRVTVSQIRPVDINDLLGREAVELNVESIAKFTHNRVVLVTGAGGSIGSEMSRQICRYKPKQLILLEQAELPLFEITNELKRKYPDISTVDCICDIYDRDRVMKIWEAYQPEVVIHAAAHKHVPMMELNPCEAIKNNILGVKNVADASFRYKTAEFVTISTDKAVNPSSVMGCSKRIGEIYTQALNDQPDCHTKYKAVRFGNVLGSSGSVVPTFRRQIAAGGPVTVTDPKMTRYFMTIPEAAQLVLQAAANGQGGQIFLLDMGEPVKIVDLAKQMITLSGFRPDEDIDIVFSGVRPGEKLFEELRTEGENLEPTVHPKILIWKHQHVPWEQVEKAIVLVKSLQNSMDRPAIIRSFQSIVPEYEPLNPPS